MRRTKFTTLALLGALAVAPVMAGETPEVLVNPDAEGVSAPYLLAGSRVAPSFPPAAYAARFGGMVSVRAVVLNDGTVGDVEVIEVTRSGLGFEQAAISAVSQWRFEPARLDGEAVDSYTWARLHFRAPGQSGASPHVATSFAPGGFTTAATGGSPVTGAMGKGAPMGSPTLQSGGDRDVFSRFATVKMPPACYKCLYDGSTLVPPPNFGLATIQGSHK